MNNINQINIENCTGCGGCAAICPHNAISLFLDVDGYINAKANDNCISCGKCVTVCPKFLNFDKAEFPKAQAMYVGNHKNLNIRYPSSSGGIVSALATVALKNGYVVAGAQLNMKECQLHHVIIEKAEDLVLIRGSKYIPSYTQNSISAIAHYNKVMFIGTPCQVYAVKKMYPDKNIIFVDFRCAGTVGYNLFNKYANFLNSINSSGIKHINFRAKNRSWHIWGIETTFNNGETYFKDKQHDLFGKCFSVYAEGVHDVCRVCRFTNQSFADIRVEDAWHQMHYVKPKDYKNGFSQITVFNKAGEDILLKASDILTIKNVENTFHNHSTARKNKPKQSTLYYMIRNDKVPLDLTIKNYEKELSLLKRALVYLSYLASINLYVYRVIRFLYKKVNRKG